MSTQSSSEDASWLPETVSAGRAQCGDWQSEGALGFRRLQHSGYAFGGLMPLDRRHAKSVPLLGERFSVS